MFIKTIDSTWRIDARARLIESGNGGPSWAYRIGGEQAAEPTALAGLALMKPEKTSIRSIARDAADWLAKRQRADGSLGSIADADAPGWPTAHALLLWNAVGTDRFESARNRAIAWLLDRRGETTPRDPNAVIGHDTSLLGWPWVDATHSWLEPTATAVLALAGAGRANHPRVVEGVRLIQDRAVLEGGWNYGNRLAFGTSLRPQPAVSGLALIALAAVKEIITIDMNMIKRSLDYLRAAVERSRSPFALGWGTLGLRAWRAEPACIETKLAEAASACLSRRDCAPRLAYLLLAGEPTALDRFGIHKSESKESI